MKLGASEETSTGGEGRKRFTVQVEDMIIYLNQQCFFRDLFNSKFVSKWCLDVLSCF